MAKTIGRNAPLKDYSDILTELEPFDAISFTQDIFHAFGFIPLPRDLECIN